MDKNESLLILSLLYLQRLDFSLSSFERIVFYRLFLTLGYECFEKKDIKEIALKIDIHYLKLEKAIEVLVKKFALTANGQGYISVNKDYLGQPNKQEKIQSGIEKLRKHPKLDFLLKLLDMLFQIKISHKQKKSKQLLEMDFKQWLVLLNLVFLSDYYGVVLGAGTHELTNYTGLSRYALLRSMTHLFKLGILRSKTDGTLNNGYLNSISAIYFINLSHPVWGEKRVFGRYFIFNCPQQTVILKQLLEVLDGFNPDKSYHELKLSEFILVSHLESVEEESGIVSEHEEPSIERILQTGRQWNSMFHLEFKLSGGYASEQRKLLLNTNELNFKRLDYIFCYLASHYPSLTSMTHISQSYFLPAKVKMMMLKLFREVMLTKPMTLKVHSHYEKFSEEEKAEITFEYVMSEIMTAQNQLKQEILSLLIKYVYRSELSHVIDSLAEITDRKNYYGGVVPISCSDQSHTHKIYFNPDPHLKKDELFTIEYSETSIQDPKIYKLDGIKLYSRSIKQINMDLKQQLELGLLSEQCMGLDKF